MRTLFSHLALGVVTMSSLAARAEVLEGVVRVAGSGINQEIQLAPEGENKGPVLCPNDQAKRVKKLAAMTVKATGEWKVDGKGEKSCFKTEAFGVTKHTSGRQPLVGTLTQKDGVYVITGDDGKAKTLSEVSGGLKKLEGKKVIVDVKPMDHAKAKETIYKVVSYGAYP